MPKTEYERCKALSDTDLIDTIRRNASASLLPCVTVLLERVEVMEEIKPAPQPKPKIARCEKCCGTGKAGLGMLQPCKSCEGTGVDLT